MIKKNYVPPTRGRESLGLPSPRAVSRGALRERESGKSFAGHRYEKKICKHII